MDLWDLYFLPMQPFVWHPERVAIVAVVLFAAFAATRLLAGRDSRLRAWPLLVPALLWTLFIPWEAHCKAEKYSIRLDLFLITPILVIATVGGIVAAFRRHRQKAGNTQANT